VKEYDVFVPLYHNDGTPIEPESFDALEQKWLDRFGGVTYSPQPKKGVWRVGDIVYRDEIVIFRVVTHESERAFFSLLKEQLKDELEQEEILIIEREIETI
jgi:hypothetical protein